MENENTEFENNQIVAEKLQKLGPYEYPGTNVDFGQIEYRKRITTEEYKYTGQWLEESRQGKGHCVWKDGKVYEGYWKDDKPKGQGRMIYAKGAYYTGMFKAGLQHG